MKDALILAGCVFIGAGCGLTVGVGGPYRRVFIFLTATILGAIWGIAMR
jgi:hypothetical protein